MAEFSYQAADARGRRSNGRLAAANRAEALGVLRARGLFPLAVREIQADAPAAERRRKRRGDVLPFTQQMATLVGAGLQLDRALAVVCELSREERLGEILAAVRRDVQEGASFSAALSRHPRYFNRIYVNMIRAGEAGGVLPPVLRRLAQTIEEERELRSFILGALLYPAVVAAASLGAVFILMIWVVPSFERIFSRLGQELPAITRWTIAASRALTAYGWWILAALAAAAATLWSLVRTPRGAEALDRLYLRLPYLGDLYLKITTAKVTRTLAMLTSAGVPVLQAFAVVKETVRNRIVAGALARTGQEIKEGGGIARRLGAQGVLPPLAVQMIAVGEETGELASMLEQVARGYDVETRRSIRNILAILEPALILCLTAVTLLIALSILVPIVSVSTGL